MLMKKPLMSRVPLKTVFGIWRIGGVFLGLSPVAVCSSGYALRYTPGSGTHLIKFFLDARRQKRSVA